MAGNPIIIPLDVITLAANKSLSAEEGIAPELQPFFAQYHISKIAKSSAGYTVFFAAAAIPVEDRAAFTTDILALAQALVIQNGKRVTLHIGPDKNRPVTVDQSSDSKSFQAACDLQWKKYEKKQTEAKETKPKRRRLTEAPQRNLSPEEIPEESLDSPETRQILAELQSAVPLRSKVDQRASIFTIRLPKHVAKEDIPSIAQSIRKALRTRDDDGVLRLSMQQAIEEGSLQAMINPELREIEITTLSIAPKSALEMLARELKKGKPRS